MPFTLLSSLRLTPMRMRVALSGTMSFVVIGKHWGAASHGVRRLWCPDVPKWPFRGREKKFRTRDSLFGPFAMDQLKALKMAHQRKKESLP